VTLGARPQAGESFVTGDVVNTTSRLQGVAPVGGVVVGEVTYRTTKDFISYEPLDPVTVKGKPIAGKWPRLLLRIGLAEVLPHRIAVAAPFQRFKKLANLFASLGFSAVRLVIYACSPAGGPPSWGLFFPLKPNGLIHWSSEKRAGALFRQDAFASGGERPCSPLMQTYSRCTFV
jgi:hypothetical protein